MITQRDKQVLTWIGEQYAVRLDQLQVLMGREPGKPTVEPGRVSPGTAERRVKVWEKAALVERQKLFFGEPAWIWLTKKGLGLLPNDYRFLRPKLATLEHIYAVNQVRLWAENEWGSTIPWQGERQLKYEFARDETTKTQHVPDAILITEAGRIALEVELTQKMAKRTKSILIRLARDYDQIWYFANAQAYPSLTKQIASLSATNQQKFRLQRLEELNI
jgi:hypothetical protein